MSSNTADGTVDTLSILTIPRLEDITERQVRGIACIWDGIPLVAANAVDLGVRKGSRAGAPVSWYPRGCRSCVAFAAVTQAALHSRACAACRNSEGPPCNQGRALHELVREYRR